APDRPLPGELACLLPKANQERMRGGAVRIVAEAAAGWAGGLGWMGGWGGDVMGLPGHVALPARALPLGSGSLVERGNRSFGDTLGAGRDRAVTALPPGCHGSRFVAGIEKNLPGGSCRKLRGGRGGQTPVFKAEAASALRAPEQAVARTKSGRDGRVR